MHGVRVEDEAAVSSAEHRRHLMLAAHVGVGKAREREEADVVREVPDTSHQGRSRGEIMATWHQGRCGGHGGAHGVVGGPSDVRRVGRGSDFAQVDEGL